MKFVAVTACPVGIAHTYIAAESLRKLAKEKGYDVKVETRGAVGIENELSQEDINAADVVILAVAVSINATQFEGKQILEVPITEAIKNPLGVFEKAIEMISTKDGEKKDERKLETKNKEDPQSNKGGFQLPKTFLSGISYIIPFLTVSGIFLTLYQVWPFPMFKDIKDYCLILIIPILSGAISFGIADRPGIVPGVLSGMIATFTPHSGVLSGLVGGFLSGWITKVIRKLKVPEEVSGLLPVFIIPTFSTLIIGLLMFVALNGPLSFVQMEITKAIGNMPLGVSIVLGALLGAMLAYDLGGPINKIAYTFGLLMMIQGVFRPQAAILVSGMVPSLAVAFVTTVFPKFYSDIERKSGKKAWLLGLSFVAEGAQPFLSINPFRMKISFMVGGAVAGALSMFFQISAVVPHGGIFAVLFVNQPYYFILSIIIGTLVSAGLVMITKIKVNMIVKSGNSFNFK